MNRVVQRLEILMCPEALDPRKENRQGFFFVFCFFTVGSV